MLQRAALWRYTLAPQLNPPHYHIWSVLFYTLYYTM